MPPERDETCVGSVLRPQGLTAGPRSWYLHWSYEGAGVSEQRFARRASWDQGGSERGLF